MAKQIVYSDNTRQAILRGVNQLADTVKVTLAPEDERRSRQEIRWPHDHQRRRDGREGD